jgi:carbon monoxide dehydrogenase subunit G
MRETFQRVMTVKGVDVADVWTSLRDVELLASCSSAIGEVAEKVPEKEWSVVLKKTVGRFSVSAPLTVAIVDESEPQSLRVHGRGSDTKIGARLDVTASMQIERIEAGVQLTLDGAYEMTGRIASLGASLVRRHANEMIDEFGGNLPQAMVAAADSDGR